MEPASPVSRDPTASARAEAAYRHEFDRWQALIDAVHADASLTTTQRAVAVSGLRHRQQLEANGARKRVLDEEQEKIKALRRARSGPANKRLPPAPT